MSVAIAAAGWRWALIALGAALGAGGLLVRAALPPERTEAGTGQAGERPAEHAGLWQLLRRRQVAAVLAAGTIAAGGRGLGTLSTYIPAYLRSGLRMSTLTVGTLFTLIMAASIAGPVAGGLLADRFGRARTLTVTYIAAAIAVAAFGFAGRSLWVLAVLGVCVGVLAYAESPLLQAVFADLTGDGAARTAFGAFFAISHGIGSLWSPSSAGSSAPPASRPRSPRWPRRSRPPPPSSPSPCEASHHRLPGPWRKIRRSAGATRPPCPLAWRPPGSPEAAVTAVRRQERARPPWSARTRRPPASRRRPRWPP